MSEFRAWEKTARLFRDITITEKIDGTNAAVIIDGETVAAQSRSRVITPDDDNFGFARWVAANADTLRDDLGDGYHFGEWWGAGIGRRYGLSGSDKRLSLFNTARHAGVVFATPGLHVVPVLYEGPFYEHRVHDALALLSKDGSVAAPGFTRPEGVCVFHHASRQIYKVTLENDGVPKSRAS